MYVSDYSYIRFFLTPVKMKTVFIGFAVEFSLPLLPSFSSHFKDLIWFQNILALCTFIRSKNWRRQRGSCR